MVKQYSAEQGIPSDFIGWTETHCEVIHDVITRLEKNNTPLLKELRRDEGRQGIWQLCLTLTNDFHKLFPHEFDWGETDKDYYIEVENFLENHFKQD